MKKILALLLVLGFAATANATVLDIVANNIWIGGDNTKVIKAPTQAQLDAVGVGDRVNLKVVLNDNGTPATFGEGPYAFSVNGYFLSNLSSDIIVTGPGQVAIAAGSLNFNSHLSLTGSDPVSGNKIPWITGTGPLEDPPGLPGGEMTTASGDPWDQLSTPMIFTRFYVTVTGTGIIDVDLTNFSVSPSVYRAGGTGAWIDFMESDYRDLQMGIPEPMTIALLGLGGLGLIYRRRRA